MKRRVFISLELPKEAKKRLIRLQKKLEAEHLAIRWLNKETLHLTLEFLGYITDEELKKVCEITKKISSNFKSFKLKFANVDVFKNISQPRVIVIRFQDSIEIMNLQNQLHEFLSKEGLVKESCLEFKPHITLGRSKKFKLDKKILKRWVGISVDFEFEVDKMNVMESKLMRSGAEYNVVRSYKLDILS